MEPRLLWITDGSPAPIATDLTTLASVECCSGESAPFHLDGGSFAAIVLDGCTVTTDIGDLLRQIGRAAPGTPILMHQPDIGVAQAVQLAHRGVSFFVEAGQAGLEQIRALVGSLRSRDLSRFADAVQSEEWERMLVGSSRAMRQVVQIIRMIGPRRATVLVTGETGTGKEIAARALHLAGPRRRASFVALNCTALPETLLEAELFGHVRGAFTGAMQSRAGRFEQAQGGTLFLDEIGEMPLELQAKLLRVLQERELQRLGSSDTIRLDVRVVAATNANLAARIEAGCFREDLYYRLNVVPLEMPPLRQRLSDVPPLVTHFIEKVCRAEELPCRDLVPEALARLCAYCWPGNVRQLENAVEMAVSLSGDRTLLTPADFPLPALGHANRAACAPTPIDLPDAGLDFDETVQGIERSILEQALRRTGGNKKAAAEMLGLKRTTLAAKVRSFASSACN